MAKPFEMTRELIVAIDHDLKEAKTTGEAVFMGIVAPVLLVPPTVLADILKTPVEIIRDKIKRR